MAVVIIDFFSVFGLFGHGKPLSDIWIILQLPRGAGFQVDSLTERSSQRFPLKNGGSSTMQVKK